MTTKTLVHPPNAYLFNQSIRLDEGPELFQVGEQQSNDTNQLGRGTAFIFDYQRHTLVLRHYRRGGMLRHLLRDQYAYTGLSKTRMWREFKLLLALREKSLPVPNPIAACCHKSTWCTYSGSLITEKIDNIGTLAEHLQGATPLSTEEWVKLGQTIARFHQHGVFHADLNANNILLDDDKQFYLIDFDKGSIKSQYGPWANNNIERLLRSLNKIARLSNQKLHFNSSNWADFKHGYQQALGAANT